ncbi:CLUMA_CG018084, isoform A [Clunio marinus]|uniref:Transmembrane protein 188 n=1 Tax=Clunio marinus TaxID=568069 RepID=A0A1J1IZX9_9DIPT|nr:CLUMA_CG018084, isoform A [Clunio marinus]
MSLEPSTCEDLKAFERRLTEVLACLQPNCLRWRIVLCIVTIISGVSAFFWLSDPQTSVLPFFDSLLNHYIFTTSALTLITLFCYGIHKLVISPQIIISRTRNVLSEFNLSCDEAGKIILRSRPNAP